MSGSREDSPDWLRDFQTPNHDFLMLSSESNSSSSDSKVKPKRVHANEVDVKRKKKMDYLYMNSPDESPVKKVTSGTHEEEAAEEVKEKQPNVPLLSSKLPLVFPEKVQRSKALIECDGDSIDLSGDVGSVGRVIISNGSNANDEFLLDLKGTIYKTRIVPSRTFCIVSVGQTEAKIEAMMNDFLQLEPQSNLFEAETMVEGTLEGFSFESDEQGEKTARPPAQGNQGDENGDKSSTKKAKKKEKPQGVVARKKAKTTKNSQSARKGSKNSQAARRAKKPKK